MVIRNPIAGCLSFSEPLSQFPLQPHWWTTLGEKISRGNGRDNVRGRPGFLLEKPRRGFSREPCVRKDKSPSYFQRIVVFLYCITRKTVMLDLCMANSPKRKFMHIQGRSLHVQMSAFFSLFFLAKTVSRRKTLPLH